MLWKFPDPTYAVRILIANDTQLLIQTLFTTITFTLATQNTNLGITSLLLNSTNRPILT